MICPMGKKGKGLSDDGEAEDALQGVLVIGVLGEGVLVESFRQGGIGRLLQREGELGLSGDFGGHAGSQQKRQTAQEEGLGVRQDFSLAEGVGDVGKFQPVVRLRLVGRVEEDVPPDQLKGGVVDFQGAQAVLRQAVDAGGDGREDAAQSGERPGAEVEGFRQDDGEPEVAFAARGALPLVFPVPEDMQGLFKECYLVHQGDTVAGRGECGRCLRNEGGWGKHYFSASSRLLHMSLQTEYTAHFKKEPGVMSRMLAARRMVSHCRGVKEEGPSLKPLKNSRDGSDGAEAAARRCSRMSTRSCCWRFFPIDLLEHQPSTVLLETPRRSASSPLERAREESRFFRSLGVIGESTGKEI